MLTMIDELIRHKWWANRNLIEAIRQHSAAAEDEELRKLLHHILVSNRYWLLLCLGQPFVDEEERRVPETMGTAAERFRETERLELEWASRLNEAELGRTVEACALPGLKISVAQVIMQTCLHSQGHRAQCATRLRTLAGTPSGTDFVLWVKQQANQAKDAGTIKF
jgi:uncharacterized damage-inducible protein DinB